MLKAIKLACVAAMTLVAGCATAPTSDIAGLARPDASPTPTLTRFDEPLTCMDRAFGDFGVSGVTIAVSAVPDYTGRVFVGSDIWLQSAITKMSQRSGAFVVTDYNPNQYAPEQGLWTLSQKEGFYIPAYYVRGAISGFANSVSESSTTFGIGGPTDGASIGGSSAYSLVSVDLTVGNLQQRTLINRARASNEIALRSRASGGQVGGVLSTLGTNIEIVSSRSEGIPHAVKALIELNAIETLGRLTGVPYWTCLGTDHNAPEAQRIRSDIFANMTEPELVVFAQRRLSQLGLYRGEINGVGNADLDRAISAFAAAKGLSSQPDGLALYNELTRWIEGETLTPAPMAAAAPPPVAPASQPVPETIERVSRPLSIQVSLASASRRPGSTLSVRLASNASVYAYCYLEDATGSVARVFPNRWQPDAAVSAGKSISVPGTGAGFDLVFPARGTQENIACFASDSEIAARLPAPLQVEDLSPLPVRSLQDLQSQFQATAARTGGAFSASRVVVRPN